VNRFDIPLQIAFLDQRSPQTYLFTKLPLLNAYVFGQAPPNNTKFFPTLPQLGSPLFRRQPFYSGRLSLTFQPLTPLLAMIVPLKALTALAPSLNPVFCAPTNIFFRFCPVRVIPNPFSPSPTVILPGECPIDFSQQSNLHLPVLLSPAFEKGYPHF